MTSIIQAEPLFRRLTQEEVDKLANDLGTMHLLIMALIVVVLCIYKISRMFRKKRPVTHNEQNIQE
jgi:predicted permease